MDTKEGTLRGKDEGGYGAVSARERGARERGTVGEG